MPTYRTAANTYAIQLLAFSTGPAANTAGFVGSNGFFGTDVLPRTVDLTPDEIFEGERESLPTAILIVDAGTGAETMSIFGKTALSDLGIGVDSPTMKVMLNIAETGTGADGVSVLQKILASILDSGTAADLISLLGKFTTVDSAVGSEIVSIKSRLTIIDAGSGIDVFTLLNVRFTILQSAFGNELLAIAAKRTQLDAGVGIEAALVNTGGPTAKRVDESGIGIELVGANQLSPALSGRKTFASPGERRLRSKHRDEFRSDAQRNFTSEP